MADEENQERAKKGANGGVLCFLAIAIAIIVSGSVMLERYSDAKDGCWEVWDWVLATVIVQGLAILLSIPGLYKRAKSKDDDDDDDAKKQATPCDCAIGAVVIGIWIWGLVIYANIEDGCRLTYENQYSGLWTWYQVILWYHTAIIALVGAVVILVCCCVCCVMGSSSD